MNTTRQLPTLREKYGFTDDEVIALLVLEREGLSELKKKRRVLYDGLIILLGINDEDFDRAKKILEEAENNMMSIDESDVPEEES